MLNEELANEKFQRGEFSAALSDFSYLQSNDPSNSWLQYHIGNCYLSLGKFDLAKFHAKAAMHNISDYKVKVLLAKVLSADGDDELLGFFESNIDDVRFVNSSFGYLCSSKSFYKSCEVVLRNFEKINAAVNPNYEWIRFFNKHRMILIKILHESIRPDISFSYRMPLIIEVLDSEFLDQLLHLSTKIKIRIISASWNLSQFLRSDPISNPVTPIYPKWFLDDGVKNNKKIIFDACEEAPLYSESDIKIHKYLNSLDNIADEIYVITANSIANPRSSEYKELIFNAYPIEVSLRAPFSAPNNKAEFLLSFLVGIPRPSRIASLIMLKRSMLLEVSNYSWWGVNNRKDSRIDAYIARTIEEYSFLNINQDEIDWLRNLPERKINATASSTHYECFSYPQDFYHSAKIHLVLETEFSQVGILRLTEKSIKPFLAGVPFLILGVSGIVGFLRSSGFDLLDDIINHEYDKISDSQVRFLALFDEIIRLSSIDFDALRLERMRITNRRVISQWSKETKTSYQDNFLSSIKSEVELPNDH